MDLELLADALGEIQLGLARWVAETGEVERLGSARDVGLDPVFRHSRTARETGRRCGNPLQPLSMTSNINCVWHGFASTDHGVLLVGPAFLCRVPEVEILQHVQAMRLSEADAKELCASYRRVPIIGYPLQVSIVAMVYRLVTGRPPEGRDPLRTAGQVDFVRLNESVEEIDAVQQRDFENAVLQERFLLDCIRRGDVERLASRPQRLHDLPSRLGPGDLRSARNNLLSGITLATRAAVEGGLPVEVAYPLADKYFLQIEAHTNVLHLYQVFSAAVMDLARRVRDHSEWAGYSPVVRRCLGYIAAHVHEPIRVTDVARLIPMTPESLSRLFRRETGASVKTHITRAKILEAQTQLAYTDLPLAQISGLLGFSSQSQLSVSFRLATGMTPQEYRRSTRR